MTQAPQMPLSMHSIEKATIGRNSEKYSRVTFHVDQGDAVSFTIPLFVSAKVDDANVVRVARNYLHRTLAQLANETAQWEISEDEMKALFAVGETTC